MLTLSEVYEKMKGIKVGDKIAFDSMAACENGMQVSRKTPIPVVGTVERLYPRFVLARLKKAKECVMWDSIHKVNGGRWSLFCKECDL